MDKFCHTDHGLLLFKQLSWIFYSRYFRFISAMAKFCHTDHGLLLFKQLRILFGCNYINIYLFLLWKNFATQIMVYCFSSSFLGFFIIDIFNLFQRWQSFATQITIYCFSSSFESSLLQLC